ncbi:MAG: RCC1 domain-containing protein, partial [Clostridia bacterium]
MQGLMDVEMVSASAAFAAALMQDGTVWTWGNNSYGQLGDGTREDSLHPVKVEGIE